MKKTLLALAMSTLAFNAYSENATYIAETKIVHIPVLEFQGAPVLSNVDLKLRNDGLFELVNAKEYAQNSDPSSPSSTESFTVDSYKIRELGEVYLTETGELITITGISGYSVTNSVSENGKWKMENGKWKMENGKWVMNFYKTTSSMPEPENGTYIVE